MELIEDENAKWCNRCETMKSFDCFHKNKKGKNGLATTCKTCYKFYRDNKFAYNQRSTAKKFRDLLLQSKYCKMCREYKSFDEYYNNKGGLYKKASYCKDCEKEYMDVYVKENPEKMQEIKNRWAEKNPEKRRQASLKWSRENVEYRKQYYEDNKEEILEKHKIYREENKDWLSKRKAEYQKENREKLNEYIKNKYHTDTNYKLYRLISGRILDVLNGRTKTDTTKYLLGCSINKFKKHIEAQWSKGMSWDNWSHDGWHLDHIISCSLFDLECEYQQKVAFHWSNYQPLWGSENMSKGNSVPDLGIEIDSNWLENRYNNKQK